MSRAALLALLLVAACGKTSPFAPLQEEPGVPAGQSDCPFDVAATGALAGDLAGTGFRLGRPLVSAGGRVYFVRTDELGGVELIRFDPIARREERVTSGDATLELLDAHGMSVLVLQQGRRAALRILRGAKDDAIDVPPVIAPAELYRGVPASVVDGDRAVWIRDQTVMTFDGSLTRVVASAAVMNDYVTMRGQWIAWAEGYVDGGTRIMLGRNGDIHAIDYAERPRAAWEELPVIGTRHIYWLSDGRLMRRGLEEREVTRVRQVTSGPPSVYGELAVYGVDEAGFGLYRELLAADEERVRTVPTLGGFVASPRLWGDLLAWVEYDSADATCTSGGAGRVVFTTVPASGDEWPLPQAIGAIGAPCLCCDAFWPPLDLTLEDYVLAWNYAARDGEAEPRLPTGLAWARFERSCP